jgi:peptidoglycan hydrolase CwlO-like protein
MSVLTDLLDRVTDISALRTQVAELVQQQREVRGLMLTQQRELAEVRGQLKALIQMQGQLQSSAKR